MSTAILAGGLMVFLGAGVSAHLLVHSEGRPSAGANTMAYWMLFGFLYAMIVSFGHHAIQGWMK